MSFRRHRQGPRTKHALRPSGLPASLGDLLGVKRKKRDRRYAAKLICGAVVVALAVGAAPRFLNPEQTPTGSLANAIDAETRAPSVSTRVAEMSELAKSTVSANVQAGARATFTFCHVGGGVNCVVDGDTIWLGGQKIRIADIDAPETHNFQCVEEKELGDRATQRLLQLLNSGAVSLRPIDRDEDRYGRKLRTVSVNGRNVSDTLVKEGLVRYYEGRRRPWC